MKKLLSFIILQLPLFLWGQMDESKLCSATFSQFFPYDVCTYDITSSRVIIYPEVIDSIYNAYYEIHFNTLDTANYNIPDTGSLIRLWYFDENGKKLRIDISNYDELFYAQEEFETLNRQIWEIVSNWKFYIKLFSKSYCIDGSELKDVWVDFVIPVLSSKQ